MARRIRIEYTGAFYHVMSRGNDRGWIFLDDVDRTKFLCTLTQAAERTGWRLHAYVLMGNHFHWLLETPEPNLVAGMKWFQGTYTQRFNCRHKRCGHLFQGRYKAILIDPGELGIFHRCSSYIHLNPLRAGMVDFEANPLRSYTWSSYPFYASSKLRCPDWLVQDRVYGSWEIDPEDPSRFQKYASALRHIAERAVSSDAAVRQAVDTEWQRLREGWYVGSDEFREEALARIAAARTGRRLEFHYGEAVRAHDERAAEVLLDRALAVVGLEVDALSSLRKNDPRKVAVAWLLKSRTTATHRWVSSRLFMGHEINVSRAVRSVESGTDPQQASLVAQLSAAMR